MKNLYYLFVILLTFTSGNAQIVNIPDANFKNALVNTNCVDLDGDFIGDIDADTNDDGEIQLTEALAVLSLIVTYNTITSVEGIQSFTNLEHFICDINLIDSLDISQNVNLISLDCDQNNLTSLDVSQNTNFEQLSFQQNEITNLDIAQNVNLTRLECSNNPLSQLDVSQNVNLTFLDISATEIINVDLTNLVNLAHLRAADVPLQMLDVSNNSNLESLFCLNNNFSSLDLSQNINLRSLECTDNQLADLDVTQNPNLTFLFIYNNDLTGLDVSQNLELEYLHVSENNIVNLDLSQNINLFYLYCIGNNLESLNMQNGNNINVMQCVTTENPNLFCIQVDDVAIPSPQNGWFQDPWSNYSEFCELGVADNEINSTVIFPNPVSDQLHISAKENISKISIHNVLGQELYNATLNAFETNLDLSGYRKGPYFIKVFVGDRFITRKLIKE